MTRQDGYRERRQAGIPVTVYTLRNADGDPLYVGCTTQYLQQRLRQHSVVQPWWDEVASVDREYFLTREAGLNRERDLIRALSPAHNVAFNRTVLDDYLAGATMREIGRAHGITFQRVQQLLQSEAPIGALEREKERRAEQRRAVRRERDERKAEATRRPCRVCGQVFVPARLRTVCSKDCRSLFLALQQQLPGRSRERRLKGRGRWLLEGSASHAAAVECFERQLPLFNLLPEDVKRQVRGEPRSWEMRKPPVGDPHPCEGCDAETTNPRFCSIECYRASGRIGKAAA